MFKKRITKGSLKPIKTNGVSVERNLVKKVNNGLVKEETISDASETAGSSSHEPENNQEAVDNSGNIDEVKERIETVRGLHRLKKRSRGLIVNEDVYETTRKQILNELSLRSAGDTAKNTINAESDERRYGFLDKSFQAQDAHSEQPADPHLEKFLEEKLQELEPLAAGGVMSSNDNSSSSVTQEQEALQDKLFEIPEQLQVPDYTKGEKDKITWVSGLMEIPLSLTDKLQNIEATEMAKREMKAKAHKDPPEPQRPGLLVNQRFYHHDTQRARLNNAFFDRFCKRTRGGYHR